MNKELKPITFRKMNDEEFSVYAKWSAKNYAEHLIKSGDEKFRFKVRKAAKSEFKDIFPYGADSADNYLYVIINENRLKNKPSKRNLDFARNDLLETDKKYRTESYDGEITFQNYIKIDNSESAPDVVAKMIKERFLL